MADKPFEFLVLHSEKSLVFENMVVMEAIKRFAEKGIRSPCYYYRTSNQLEVDLIIHYGDYLEAFEIKFTSSPNKQMVQSLAKFKEEFPVKRALLLNLRQTKLPFSNGVIAEHWSNFKL